MNLKLNLLPRPKHISIIGDSLIRIPSGPLNVAIQNMGEADVNACIHALDATGFRKIRMTDDSQKAWLVLAGGFPRLCDKPVRQDARNQAYDLHVESQQVRITAPGVPGIVYGLQTLRQIMIDHPMIPELSISDWPDLPLRGIHLTLGSGHMPRFDKLLELIDLFAAHKLNTLFLEYDDRFPFDRHPQLVHPDALSKDQICQLIACAGKRMINIIPVLDSLGHAEYYLKHSTYRHLAELPDQQAEMCPSNPKTLQFVQELWREILDLHSGCQIAHVTGDEVFRLGGHCPECSRRARQNGEGVLYYDYYRQLCTWILEQGRRPMMWSDMALAHPVGLDSLPREVIFADWNYGGTDAPRWHETNVWGHGGMLAGETGELAPEYRQLLSGYLCSPEDPQSLQPFPYVRTLQDRGFGVVGASAFSGRNILPAATFRHPIENTRGFSNALRCAGAMGLMSCFWSDNAPVNSSLHGMLAAAAYSWGDTAESTDDFLDRITQVLPDLRETPLKKIAAEMDFAGVMPRGAHGAGIRRQQGADRPHLPAAHASAAGPAGDYLAILDVNDELAHILTDLRNLLADYQMAHIAGGGGEPISISDHMNTSDRKFASHHLLHLRDLGPGRVRLWDVPFDIASPVVNGGNMLVAVAGRYAQSFPNSVSIPMHGQWTRLFFLNTSAWSETGRVAAHYRVHFADGSCDNIDMIPGHNTGDWYSGTFLLDRGLIAWDAWLNLVEPIRRTVYLAWWDHPKAGLPISRIDIISGGGAAHHGLLAITGRKEEPAYAVTANQWRGWLRQGESILARLSSIEERYQPVYASLFGKDDCRIAMNKLREKCEKFRITLYAVLSTCRSRLNAGASPTIRTCIDSDFRVPKPAGA